jgi:hypothetical protein
MTEQAKHTPGPWCLYQDGLWFDIYTADDEHVVAIQTAIANARLIAAAPEMYEALCAVMSDTDDLDLDIVADLINAALLKAEGR